MPRFPELATNSVVASAGVAIAAGGLAVALSFHKSEYDGRVQSLTTQAKDEIAGFQSFNKDDVVSLGKNLGYGPLRVTYLNPGSVELMTCIATIGYNPFPPSNKRSSTSDMAIKKLNDCPPKP